MTCGLGSMVCLFVLLIVQSSVSVLIYQESWTKLHLGNWFALVLHKDVGVIYAFMFWKINIPHLNAKSLLWLLLGYH